MQAHAVRLDDAWVIPTWIGFSFCLPSAVDQETEAGKEAAHMISGFCVQSHGAREKWQYDSVSLCFSTSQLPTLKRCKNIYYMTRLDVLFCTVWCNSFISPWNIQIHSSACMLFPHTNELVNIQMTPQKNWHLERIEYKHLYSFSSCSRLNISL